MSVKIKKKNIIIIFILILICIISLIFLLNKNPKISNDNNEKKHIESDYEIILKEEKNISSDFKTAFEMANELYSSDANIFNFNVYYSANYLIQYFPNMDFKYIDNVNILEFRDVTLYSKDGKKINEFPTNDYSNDILNLEKNKNYLVRIWSSESKITYYYLLKIDNNYNINEEFICYSKGENDISGIYLDNKSNNEIIIE